MNDDAEESSSSSSSSSSTTTNSNHQPQQENSNSAVAVVENETNTDDTTTAGTTKTTTASSTTTAIAVPNHHDTTTNNNNDDDTGTAFDHVTGKNTEVVDNDNNNNAASNLEMKVHESADVVVEDQPSPLHDTMDPTTDTTTIDPSGRTRAPTLLSPLQEPELQPKSPIESSPPSTSTPPPRTAIAHTNLQSLPIDALHCIASFMTPHEFVTQYGTLNRSTQQLCRTILQRVYLHAFKCWCELVVAYRYYHQHEDACELAALYVQNGIPIYPSAWGHAYHTIHWKMNIEIQEQQQQQQRSVVATTSTTPTTTAAVIPEEGELTVAVSNIDHSNSNSSGRSHVDPFYGTARLQHRTGRNYTYLEEKCQFCVRPEHPDIPAHRTNEDTEPNTGMVAPHHRPPHRRGLSSSTTPTNVDPR